MLNINNNIQLLDFLVEQELEVFSPEQLKAHFGEIETKVYMQLETMVRQGWLTKLKKGLYARNPMQQRGQDYLPNWHKVAKGLMQERPYYIAFYSALQMHELITQPALKEYIISPVRVNPKVQILQNVSFEIIYFKWDRFFGHKEIWVDDHVKAYCSGLEKTIIDCLLMPQYAGGYEGIVKALEKARHKIKPNVLIEYVIRMKVQAITKRLGYVLDKLGMYPTERDILHGMISESYTKLDPSLDLKGKYNRKWRIEDNVDLEDIIQTTNS